MNAQPPAPPPSPPPPAPPPPYRGGPTTNGNAIASLAVALVSFCLCQLGGIAAIILAHSARAQIRASGGTETGEGIATAGEVLGWIELGLFLLGLAAIVGLILVGSQTRNVFCNISIGLGQ